MITTSRRIISLFIAAIMIMTMAVSIYAETTSGKCGENARWTYDISSKTLTITGSGVIDDIDYASSQPWKDFSAAAEKIIVSDGITKIGNNAFKGFEAITSVSFSRSLNTIGNDAFSGCTSLSDISLPQSLRVIGSYAFDHCFMIESVTIPSGVSEISEGTFSTCSMLSELKLPSSLVLIGNSAFKSCKALESVSIPAGVTSIGSNAFDTCTKLKTVEFSNYSKLVSIGERAFSECSEIEFIKIPSSVLTIGNYAFFNDRKITSLVFDTPSKVTNIGNYAFSKTKVSEVTVPASTESLGDGAFFACNALETISVPSSLSYAGSDITKECNSLKLVKIGKVEITGENVCSMSGYSVNKAVVVTGGYNQKYSTEDTGLRVTVNNEKGNITPEEYAGVTIESSGVYKAVPEEYITIGEKGLKITVSNDFLKELPNGIHTIYIATTDGLASARFSLTDAKLSLADYFAGDDMNPEDSDADEIVIDESDGNPNTGARVFDF